MAKAYVPTALLCTVVAGGGGTRYDCLGGSDESERSTLTYVSYASPSDTSGTQARRSEDATALLGEDDEEGVVSVFGDFC